MQKCAFSTAAFTREGKAFTSAQRQIDTPQDLKWAVSGGIGFMNIFGVQQHTWCPLG